MIQPINCVDIIVQICASTVEELHLKHCVMGHNNWNPKAYLQTFIHEYLGKVLTDIDWHWYLIRPVNGVNLAAWPRQNIALLQMRWKY